MLDQVPEVAEAAATGLVACLYRDIREVTGARLVNLVYRHLATDPDVLNWAWHALRPHFVSGLLPRQAALLRAGVERRNQALPVVPVTELPSSAMSAVPVLRTYCHTNTLNMMAMTHLLGQYEPRADVEDGIGIAPGTGGDRALVELAPTASLGSAALPPLPGWDQLDEKSLAAILRINQFGEDAAPTIVASLYRHLGCWPALLPPVEEWLTPLQRDGLLQAARESTVSDARQLARRQPLLLPAPPPAFSAGDHGFDAFLTRLTGITIAKMIPIGCLLLDRFEMATTE